jgi:hypothetical protein
MVEQEMGLELLMPLGVAVAVQALLELGPQLRLLVRVVMAQHLLFLVHL